jgi:hypothetical protein
MVELDEGVHNEYRESDPFGGRCEVQFRTIQKTADTGGLNRDLVRAAVIRVRDRRWAAVARAAARPGGARAVREEPRAPYGTPSPDEGDGDGG